ncbi:MAG: helix-turn-helix transcriptional regulator [Clostridium tyrobutyricum]|jgi:putative transcriptional regulator|uniref:helix-turn-helix domain-containing protein n=1 Tax=Clostridium tyrobutyricum TaxID=1519 RepID=UPI00242E2C77|nr:helix-turn-helix transcriptional regulator [Clostridium tyrobutyricum]MCH4200554.1 helix-turn-helix transcriptional regulator [Clostridium tyrobutyricum]MCH4237598.1 helix-turn-helix transcriptional regulator [Clostridium tyrobutyricum]MCH4259691.1 helix-turn-helix transcriptional regulator [Clostridium tyrobutyricum]
MQIILKEYLSKENKTGYWLYKKTGLTKKTVYDLINNKTDGIKFDTLDKICKALDCTPNDILK